MRKKTRSWVFLLVFIFLCASLLWFFWDDIRELIKPAGKKSPPSQEKILDEERKKLEEILKRR